MNVVQNRWNLGGTHITVAIQTERSTNAPEFGLMAALTETVERYVRTAAESGGTL